MHYYHRNGDSKVKSEICLKHDSKSQSMKVVMSCLGIKNAVTNLHHNCRQTVVSAWRRSLPRRSAVVVTVPTWHVEQLWCRRPDISVRLGDWCHPGPAGTLTDRGLSTRHVWSLVRRHVSSSPSTTLPPSSSSYIHLTTTVWTALASCSRTHKVPFGRSSDPLPQPDNTWISVERTTVGRLWWTTTTTAVSVVSETNRTPNST